MSKKTNCKTITNTEEFEVESDPTDTASGNGSVLLNEMSEETGGL